jgi:ribosome-associated translation inhibitor RaiA
VFGIHLDEDTRTHIRGKVERKLRKFAASIERVSIRVRDVNGPRGGIDQACRVKVVLRNLPSVVFEKQNVSLDVAVGRAIAGAERTVRRSLLRRRSRPLKKGATSLAVQQTDF